MLFRSESSAAFSSSEKNINVNYNDRIDLSSTTDSDDDSKLKDLLNVHEPEEIRAKDRPKESLNKKRLMTRKKKAAARFTKRDFSRFEHVEREIEAKQSDDERGRRRDEEKNQRKEQREEQREKQREKQQKDQRDHEASHRQRDERIQQESDVNTRVYESTRSKNHISSTSIDIFFYEISSIDDENMNMSSN